MWNPLITKAEKPTTPPQIVESFLQQPSESNKASALQASGTIQRYTNGHYSGANINAQEKPYSRTTCWLGYSPGNKPGANIDTNIYSVFPSELPAGLPGTQPSMRGNTVALNLPQGPPAKLEEKTRATCYVRLVAGQQWKLTEHLWSLLVLR